MYKQQVSGLFALLLAIPQLAGAELKQAKFTQVVNQVKVLNEAAKIERQARTNDLFATPEVLRTGPASRAELVAADQTITRVGANTIFSFEAARRTIHLERGSLLFQSPKGRGGGTIRTGAATAAVLGTTLIVTTTSNGGFKVLMLEGRGRVTLRNGRSQTLRAGQMTFIMPGTERLAPIINFRLDQLVKGSQLVQGFQQPLPSMERIQTAITRQTAAIQSGRAADTGLLVGDARSATGVQIIDANVLQMRVENRILERIRERPRLPEAPEFPYEPPTIPDLTIDAVIDTPELDPARVAGDTRLFLARNIQVNTPRIDLSPFNQEDEPFQFYATQTMDFTTSTVLSGLTGPDQDLILFAGGEFRLANGAQITLEGSGHLAVVSSPDLSLVNNSFVAAGREINIYSLLGNLNMQGGRIQADTTSLYAIRNLNLAGVAFMDVANINLTAHTLTLTGIDFPAGSSVTLSSSLGVLAPQPNTGRPSVPGLVNFISGVNYGGQPAQDFVNNGRGITIFPNGLELP